MGRIVILGTSNAVPDEEHQNTHLAIQQGDRYVLVDCTGNPIVRLRQAGIPFDAISDLIVTHFHPDHVSAVPILLMDLWLLGRTEPLTVHGFTYTIDRLEKMMDLYEWQRWPDFFEVIYHRVSEQELVNVLDYPDLRIQSTPVRHLLPTMGLRVTFLPEGKMMAYSCDTEPCPQVLDLAAGVDLLIHEATGASIGHSSSAQAGEAARQASAKSLCLIHYVSPLQGGNVELLLSQARKEYSGTIILSQDLMKIDINDPIR